MKTLYVLYDEHCELCKRLKDWLLGQRCWLSLRVLPAMSDASRAMFPGLEQVAGAADLAVISDTGEVYLNNHAWIMCLYALEEYRDWALRLASPVLLPFARRAFDTISKNRAALSRWIGASEQEVAAELNVAPPCESGECRNPTTPMLENNVRDYLQ